MNDNFEIALQLLGIGMITVFSILFIVVFVGNVIIRFVNRFLPPIKPNLVVSKATNNKIDSGKMAAIISAVQTVTGGKGKVVNVEKL